MAKIYLAPLEGEGYAMVNKERLARMLESVGYRRISREEARRRNKRASYLDAKLARELQNRG